MFEILSAVLYMYNPGTSVKYWHWCSGVFCGKETSLWIFPSFRVKGPQEHGQFLGIKMSALNGNYEPRKFFVLAEAVCHFPRCIAGSFHSWLRRGKKHVFWIYLIENKNGFGRCRCTCDSMLCDMLDWHVDNCRHIWVCWCKPSQLGLLFC